MIVILIALLIDLLRGFLPFQGARPFFHEAFFFAGRMVARRERADTRPRIALIRGAIITLALATVAAGAGRLFDVIPAPYAPYGGILFLACAIKICRPIFLLRRFSLNLKQDHGADAFAAARQAVHKAAQEAEAHFIGPLFWYVCAGAEGALLFIAFRALDQAFGFGESRHKKFFGVIARGFNAILSAPVSILTGCTLGLCAAFVPGGHPLSAFSLLWRQAIRRGRLAACATAAMAGGVGVALPSAQGWIGTEGASAKVTPVDLGRAGLILAVMYLVAVAKISIATVIGF